jgi:hypothetical protein
MFNRSGEAAAAIRHGADGQGPLTGEVSLGIRRP